MTDHAQSSFVYVTYVKTSPDRLWESLIDPDFVAQYWLGNRPEADWRLGGSWKLLFPDGRIADQGEIIAFEPAKRLGIRWRNEWKPEFNAEGYSVCMMELEPVGDGVKLSVTHSIERADSQFIAAVSGGWPKILSNLKSLIETGTVVLPNKP
jgi:uncharacterized protein YndB with AHSA1/START domain